MKILIRKSYGKPQSALCVGFAFLSPLRWQKKAAKISRLEYKIKTLQDLQKHKVADNQISMLESLKDEYKALTISKAEFILHRNRQKCYLDSEQPSHLLTLLLKDCETKAHIPAIKDADGKIIINSQAINDTFSSFFENLYKSEIDFNKSDCTDFLDKLNLPQITQADQANLEAR